MKLLQNIPVIPHNSCDLALGPLLWILIWHSQSSLRPNMKEDTVYGALSYVHPGPIHYLSAGNDNSSPSLPHAHGLPLLIRGNMSTPLPCKEWTTEKKKPCDTGGVSVIDRERERDGGRPESVLTCACFGGGGAVIIQISPPHNTGL